MLTQHVTTQMRFGILLCANIYLRIVPPWSIFQVTPFHVRIAVETFPGACVCFVLNLLTNTHDVVLTMPYFRKSFSSTH